jgi:type II restriction enzyme
MTPGTDLISPVALEDLGDALRLHHCFSREPFTKDKFEYTLERTLKASGIAAELAPRGNPGYDIKIGSQRFSLKTQADKSIRPDKIHVSKFMELGKGNWTDRPQQLNGLRDQFFQHLKDYDRILTLRCLRRPPEGQWLYELVEIPKALLLEARTGTLEMMKNSAQTPKPGYCHVCTPAGDPKFSLYFDGGTERKLQIKHLNKAFCIVHAQWEFAEPDVLNE